MIKKSNKVSISIGMIFSTGFQFDIIKDVAATSGLKVEVSFNPWKEALENLRTGKIDVMAMSYS